MVRSETDPNSLGEQSLMQICQDPAQTGCIEESSQISVMDLKWKDGL